MDNRIIKNNMKNFLNSYGIKEKKESRQFELFATYCAVSQLYNSIFDLNDIITGGGNDCGIDAIAVIVNGELLNNESEIDDINTIVEIKFVFIQAKTSPHFDSGDITTFGRGVRYVLDEVHKRKHNNAIEEKIRLIEAVFKKNIKCKPTVYMYYITTGRWVNDVNCQESIDEINTSLGKNNIYDNIEFVPVDADKLNKYYSESINAIEVEIILPERNRIPLPMTEGIKQSYLAYIDYAEFKKIIMNESEELIQKVFVDNIRDYQGENQVNDEIKHTIENDSEKFVLFNNGIAIICKDMQIAPQNRIKLIDYQIVNGCQTSNVIYSCRNSVKNNNLQIPIKIIQTDDDDIINRIIKATNSQTPINETQLKGLNNFTKKLEEFYNAFPDEERLYYERRSKQYSYISSVERSRIITTKDQIKSLAAMFYDTPYLASRFYARILDAKKDIFSNNHQLEPYYTSAYTLYKFESLIQDKIIGKEYRKYRYFVITLLKYQVLGKDKAKLSENKIKDYCKLILDVVNDNKKFTKNCKYICKIIKEEVNDLDDTEKTKSADVFKNMKKRVLRENRKLNK